MRCARRRWTASACCWSPARTTTRGAVCYAEAPAVAEKSAWPHAFPALPVPCGPGHGVVLSSDGLLFQQCVPILQRAGSFWPGVEAGAVWLPTTVCPVLQAGLRQEPVGGPGAVGAPALARRGAGHPPLERHGASLSTLSSQHCRPVCRASTQRTREMRRLRLRLSAGRVTCRLPQPVCVVLCDECPLICDTAPQHHVGSASHWVGAVEERHCQAFCCSFFSHPGLPLPAHCCMVVSQTPDSSLSSNI